MQTTPTDPDSAFLATDPPGFRPYGAMSALLLERFLSVMPEAYMPYRAAAEQALVRYVHTADKQELLRVLESDTPWAAVDNIIWTITTSEVLELQKWITSSIKRAEDARVSVKPREGATDEGAPGN